MCQTVSQSARKVQKLVEKMRKTVSQFARKVKARNEQSNLGDESTFAEIWGISKICLEDNLKIDVKFMDDDEAREHDCDLTSCEGDM